MGSVARLRDLDRHHGAAWDGRAAENPFGMFVLSGIPESLAAVSPARDDHRKFRGEFDLSLGNRRLLADRRPGCFGFRLRADPRLSLAVIAVAPGLEDYRQAELSDRRSDVVEAGYWPPRSDTRAALLDELFLLRAVLGDGERARARAELVAEDCKRVAGEILELISDDVDRIAEGLERG